jgi:hypothetical protein
MTKMKKKHRLGCEQLETRDLMAGNVTVSFTSSRILIKGDNAANDVWVTSDNSGVNRIENVGGTVNGKNQALTFSVKERLLTINTDGGADTIHVQGTSSRRMQLELLLIGSDDAGPEGRDKIFMNYVNVASDGGNAAIILTGSANYSDTVSIKNTTIKGGMGIGTGKGNDRVTMENVRVGEDLRVFLEDGDDELIRTDVFFAEGLLDGGNGADTSTRKGGSAAQTFKNF